MPSTNDYLEHLAKLSGEHNLDVIMGAEAGAGRAWKRMRRVHIPHVRGEISYFVALHEIGHVLTVRGGEPALAREGKAWSWALAAAICEPSSRGRRSINRRLHGYLEWARAHPELGEALLPPADDCFWLVLEATSSSAQ